MKKVSKILVVSLILSLMITVFVNAGDVDFYYHMQPSTLGDYYISGPNVYNTKAVSHENWTANVYSISYPKTPASYGVALCVFYAGNSYIDIVRDAESAIMWRSSTGRQEKGWRNSSCGIAGRTYAIGARLDTLLKSDGTVSGVWNSDSKY